MTRIALYGGSFNPPHQGHLDVVRWLTNQWQMDFDEIWVLPTVGHAFGKGLLPYEVREEMLRAMLGRELTTMVRVVRRDETYTADMLDALRWERPGTKFTVVVGADIIHERHRWHRWDDIVAQTELLVVARKGITPPEGPWQVHEIGSEAMSSSAIRERLADGDFCLDVLPPAVAEYIVEHRLYGFTPPPDCDLL